MASFPGLENWLGEGVQDASEETFLLFSQDLPSHNLGFVDNKATTLDVDVAGQLMTFRQSPGLLTSNRQAGTTGAVLWKITPLIAEWLASMPQLLTETQVLTPNAVVVELGCGITGLIGILLAPKVSKYILTDQLYVMKTLTENISRNLLLAKPLGGRGKAHNTQPAASKLPKTLKTMPLDWETDSASGLSEELNVGQPVNLVIVCDCVYNEYLVRPLIDTLVELCQLNSSNTKPTTILIAQQLRSDGIFELFLEKLLEHFKIWRVSDEHLPASVRSKSGYVIHLANLNNTEGN